MNNRDETIREKLLERLTAVNVDARNLAVEMATGLLIVRGSVATEAERLRALEALAGAHTIEIAVRPAAPIDSADGRGRSSVTGTSADRRTRAGGRPIRREIASALLTGTTLPHR